MELTREEAIRLHRELWGWLAENPMKGKTNWPGWDKHKKFDGRNSDCFLCEYAGFDGAFSKCENCPVVFVENTLIKGTAHYCLGGLFSQWYHASAPEERSRLAALIRDLPEKKETKPAFKIGDRVKVLGTGNFHTTYEKFFAENDLTEFANNFKYGECPSNGEVLQVKAHSIEPDKQYGFIYVLQSQNGQIYLSNNRNNYLELIEEPKPEPKFKPGDRVVPVSKTELPGTEGDKFINDNPYWAKKGGKEQGYLYVARYPNSIEEKYAIQDNLLYICNVAKDATEGEYYFESDLRLYVEPPECKFKVGDRVRVRSWEEMLKEFGLDDDGDISIPGEPCFNRAMQYLCGQKFTVTKTDGIWVEGLDSGGWNITVSMLESLPINHCPENKTVEDTCVGKIDRFPRKFIFSGSKTTCIIALDGKWYKGTAKCAPSDKWDEVLGAELAYARARIALWKDHERQLLSKN